MPLAVSGGFDAPATIALVRSLNLLMAVSIAALALPAPVYVHRVAPVPQTWRAAPASH
jgi:hypothetical protein